MIKIIQIPLSSIDDVYGKDNFDNAGDDIIEILNSISDYKNQFKISFDFSAEHSNPFYHSLDVKITNITNEQFIKVVKLIEKLKLKTVETENKKN